MQINVMIGGIEWNWKMNIKSNGREICIGFEVCFLHFIDWVDVQSVGFEHVLQWSALDTFYDICLKIQIFCMIPHGILLLSI